MALPGAVTRRTVYATYVDGSGRPMTGFLTFTPRVVLSDAPDDYFFGMSPVRADLDSSGAFTATLVCTDDSSVTPAGWTWHVKEHITGGREYDIAVPFSGGPMALTDAVPLFPTGSYSGFIQLSEKGAANGVAPLDSAGHIPSGYLPGGSSFVYFADLPPSSPTANQLWWQLSSDILYRWNTTDSLWHPVLGSLAVGSGYVDLYGDLYVG